MENLKKEQVIMPNLTTRSLMAFFLFFTAFILNGLPCKAEQGTEKTFTNSLGMEFVLIPKGAFLMGTPMDEPGREKDELQHKVILEKPFYMQTTEVTVKQWRSVMGKSFFGGKKGEDDMPVVKVSCQDCVSFIKKLNALNEGAYRLPTEAEWEYACRAGSKTAYSWGNDIDCSKANYSTNTLKSSECVSSAKEKGLEPDQPSPVKSYAPNAFGLYDMNGNVWEWCQDWYAPYDGNKITNPTGPKSGSDKIRRGGSWYGAGQRCRSGNRNFSHFANRYQTTGFRLVKEIK